MKSQSLTRCTFTLTKTKITTGLGRTIRFWALISASCVLFVHMPEAAADQRSPLSACRYASASATELIAKTDADLAQRDWKVAGVAVKNLKAKYNETRFVYSQNTGWLIPFGLYDGAKQVASMFSMVSCDGAVEYSSE